jgi:hypothetical protein
MARVEFGWAGGGLTEPLETIFDTGAPFGVLPRCIWQPLDAEILVPETTFGGISQRKVCQIRAAFGSVQGRLVDKEGHATRAYDFPAFLAQTDRVPLILGFAGLLEKFTNHFDYQSGEAWIEER